jgi:oxygen-dependent protoporphyrinogen oxidase
VFAGISGGLGRLPGAVAADLRALGATILTGQSARSLHRHGDGWRVVVGAVPQQQVLEADAVVLAVPAYSASGLLSHLVPSVASDLGLIQHASMAIIAAAYRVGDVPTDLVGTGFLVPPSEGRTVKGVTYSSAKWRWLATMARSDHSDGLMVVRASIGRLGDNAVLGMDDRDIADLAHADLVQAIGARGRPVATRVTRWEHALPQYAVGHVDRIERVRARVADVPGLEVCGAAFDGVGVASVIGSARTAASGVLRHLRQHAQLQHG